MVAVQRAGNVGLVLILPSRANSCVDSRANSRVDSHAQREEEDVVVGQTVIAPFKGNKYFSARVLSIQPRRFFEIYFDDGSVSRLVPFFLFLCNRKKNEFGRRKHTDGMKL